MKKYCLLLGRILFTLEFFTALGTLFGDKAVAGAAAQGFPLPAITAKLAALLVLLGSLSVLLGYKIKVGVWMLILFLIPVTFTMHAYWKIEDPIKHTEQSIAFFKNINAIGGAFILFYFGAGPLSIDAALERKNN